MSTSLFVVPKEEFRFALDSLGLNDIGVVWPPGEVWGRTTARMLTWSHRVPGSLDRFH